MEKQLYILEDGSYIRESGKLKKVESSRLEETKEEPKKEDKKKKEKKKK